MDVVNSDSKPKTAKQMQEQTKELHDKAKQDANLASSIQLALEIENGFKLFSYRIIPVDTFITKVNELVKEYNTNFK